MEFNRGDRVVISKLAQVLWEDRRGQELVELRKNQTVGIVRHGSAFVTMVDFPGSDGLNIPTSDLFAVQPPALHISQEVIDAIAQCGVTVAEFCERFRQASQGLILRGQDELSHNSFE